jgi:hypothetical protein
MNHLDPNLLNIFLLIDSLNLLHTFFFKTNLFALTEGKPVNTKEGNRKNTYSINKKAVIKLNSS